MKPELSTFDKILPTILKFTSLRRQSQLGKPCLSLQPTRRGGKVASFEKYTTFTKFGNEFFRSEHPDSSSPARKATAQAILSYLISLQKHATRWPIFSCKSLSYVKAALGAIRQTISTIGKSHNLPSSVGRVEKHKKRHSEERSDVAISLAFNS